MQYQLFVLTVINTASVYDIRYAYECWLSYSRFLVDDVPPPYVNPSIISWQVIRDGIPQLVIVPFPCSTVVP